jgi:plastocyanin
VSEPREPRSQERSKKTGEQAGDTLSEFPPESRRRRVGLTVAVVFGVMLVLATAGAVLDMVIQSNTTVRDRTHAGGTIHLQARNFQYVPTSLLARGQDSVTIAVTNDGVSQHSFTIDELGIDVVVQPGQTATVVVRAQGVPQSYEFYCRFHQTYGMRGTVGFREAPEG